MENKTNLKLPVFIGSDQPELLKEVDEFIKTKSDNLELVVINPEIQDTLKHMYVMAAMDKDQREQIEAARQDSVEVARAINAARSLNSVLSIELAKDDAGYVIESFTKSEARKIILRQRGKISNKDWGELFEFISFHDLVTPVETEENKQHLVKWKFNFTPKQKMDNTTELIMNLEKQIDQLVSNIRLLHDNREIYEKRLHG